MLIVLSPAKTLNFEKSPVEKYSMPRFLEKSGDLVEVLKKKKAKDLQRLMGVSEKIAQLNEARFQNFSTPFSTENSKQALLAFQGDVYQGLDAATFSNAELDFAQKHLRILSGLYGLLKPLDLMQPYRLEMGTKLKTRKFKNLYHFWDTKITETINADLVESGSSILLNLASKEYFSAIKTTKLQGKLLTVHFKENRNGVLKVISFSAKKARGGMAKQIVQNSIIKPDALKELMVDGYIFDEKMSTDEDFYFLK